MNDNQVDRYGARIQVVAALDAVYLLIEIDNGTRAQITFKNPADLLSLAGDLEDAAINLSKDLPEQKQLKAVDAWISQHGVGDPKGT